MTTKNAIIAATLTAAVGAAIYEAHRASVSSDEAQSLQQQLVKLAQEIEALTRERDAATAKLAALRDEMERLRHNSGDLPGFREELARLRRDSQELAELKAASSSDPTDAAASSWLAVVKQLKQRLEEMPQTQIPELQFLDAFDWLELAHGARLDTDAGYRKALGEVRKRAEGYFTKRFQSALNTYMGDNNGQWPTDLAQLKSYFNPPVEDTILQRWVIVPKTTFPGREFAGDLVLTEKSPVDADFDHRWTIDGPFSGGVGPYNYQPSESQMELQTLKTSLEPALKAYSAANGGKEPHDPYQLQPYVSDSTQSSALQRFIQIVATNNAGR